MRQPRRIFRRASGKAPGRAVAILLASAVAAAGLVGAVTLLPALPRFAHRVPVPQRIEVEPREVSVVDGDTLRLQGLVVRLAGIVAPSRGTACAGGSHDGTDCGRGAALVLAGLVRDRRLDCRLHGQDALGRPFAACNASGTDLSSAVVASGWARARKDSPALAQLEARARAQGAGLWAEPRRD